MKPKIKAFLIVEGNDHSTANWYYAHYSWQALDAAKRDGFDESVGFAIVKTMTLEEVSFNAE